MKTKLRTFEEIRKDIFNKLPKDMYGPNIHRLVNVFAQTLFEQQKYMKRYFEELVDNAGSSKTPIIGGECDDCGKIKPDVQERNCPYAEDIHAEEIKVVICDDCCHERAMDI